MEIKTDFKKDFNLSKVYLDNAATTLKPKQVVDKINEYYKEYCANIHRGLYDWSLKASEEYEKAREIIAKYINAKPNEIIFTRGTTESINLFATIFRKKHGKIKVLNSISEHHSNLLPWKENYIVKYVGLDENYKHNLEEIKEKSKNTKIIALNHVSNVLGIKNNLKEIGKIAKENENIFVVDAAQSIAHTKIDVKKQNIDVLAFSGHKMLGPTGIGVLYVKEELIKELPNYQVGGGTIKNVSLKQVEYAKSPSRFEAGTPNIAGAIGLGEAIKYIKKIGLEKIEEHEKTLVKILLKGLNDLNAEIIGNTLKDKLGVVAFNFKNINPNDLAMQLSLEGIFLRSGHHCAIPLHNYFGKEKSIRASLYFYNTKKDIEKLLATITKYI